jgi:CDP-diacylglycerol pyrophosphatase
MRRYPMPRAILVSALALVLAASAAAQSGLADATNHRAVVTAALRSARDECLKSGPSATCEPHPEEGYVIIKDLCGKTQHLLIPTEPVHGESVPGIEAPLLLTATAPNYWQAAWAAGSRIIGGDIMLGVNAKPGRSADVLHIHIDKINPAFRSALAAELDGRKLPAPGEAPLTGLRFFGHGFDLWRVKSLEPNLFQSLPKDRQQRMACQSLAVTSDGEGGFLVLNGEAVPADSCEPLSGLEDNANADRLELDDHGVAADAYPSAHCRAP